MSAAPSHELAWDAMALLLVLSVQSGVGSCSIDTCHIASCKSLTNACRFLLELRMGVDRAPLPCLDSATPVGLDPASPFPCVYMQCLSCQAITVQCHYCPSPLHVRVHSGKTRSFPQVSVRPSQRHKVSQEARLGMKSECLGSGLWFPFTCVGLEPYLSPSFLLIKVFL